MDESTPINAPAPYGAVPSPRQLAWHQLQYYGFLHFTVNTFTDLEWGWGGEEPGIFNPTDFSAEQIAETAAQGGMKGLILTAKHHDGFCLWPSDFTDHSVKHSPWKGGKGDVVEEIAQACGRYKLKFGVYLSPWDRNHADYARPEYITYYRRQLHELLTRYGPLFEVWFDGANGGDGYYGGTNEHREIDARTYYEWDETFQMIRDLQPDACIFGGTPGADVRWVGNEDGIAGDPCWHTFDLEEIESATLEMLNTGQRGGLVWYPAECDVSIRPGWFYHIHQDERVRTAENLLNLYFKSVGRGGSLLLNLPPTPAGQIHPLDRKALLAFRRLRENLVSNDLARGAHVSASSSRAGSPDFLPQNLINQRAGMYWSTDDGETTPSAELRFDQPVQFNVVGLSEHLPLGQRVEAFALDAWMGTDWQQIYSGEAIGHKRLLRLPDVTTTAVRLRITRSPVCPAISALNLYMERN